MSDTGRPLRTATAAVLVQAGLTAGMPSGQLEQFLADLVGAGPMASGLDRRTFLKVLGLGAGGVAAALWLPGQTTVVVAPDRAVVAATADDLAALRAAFPGPFMTHWRTPVTFGSLDVTQALRTLSDREYALAVARGRRILAERPAARAARAREAAAAAREFEQWIGPSQRLPRAPRRLR